MNFGEKLLTARQAAGLTQEQAAEYLNVSRQTISNWENSKTYPDILMSIELSKLYGIDMTSLLEDKAGSIGNVREILKRYDYAKCAKNYRYLLLLVIPRILISLITNERITGGDPTVILIGSILSLIINLLQAYFIYLLASEDERFKKAAILYACSSVVATIAVFVSINHLALRSILSLIGLGITVFYVINYYPANADLLSALDSALSAKWLLIKKLYLITAIITCVAPVLVFTPVLLTAILAIAVLVVVVYIMELIALSKSSKICALYAEAVGKSMEDEPQN